MTQGEKKEGLHLNAKKAKVVTIGKDIDPDISINGSKLEQTRKFKYLRSTERDSTICSEDTRKRIAMATSNSSLKQYIKSTQHVRTGKIEKMYKRQGVFFEKYSPV